MSAAPQITVARDEAHKSFRLSGRGTIAVKDRIKEIPGARFWGRGATAYWSVPEQYEDALRSILGGNLEGAPASEGQEKQQRAAPAAERKQCPSIAEKGPVQRAAINYPATFTGGDSLRYQIVIYTAPLPSKGQRFRLGERVEEYIIIEVEEGAPADWAMGVSENDASQSVEIELRRGEFYNLETGEKVKFC